MKNTQIITAFPINFLSLEMTMNETLIIDGLILKNKREREGEREERDRERQRERQRETEREILLRNEEMSEKF